MYALDNSFSSDIEAIEALLVAFSDRHKNTSIDSSEMVLVSELENQICVLRDSIFVKYSEGGLWTKDYSSSKTAIEHKTHRSNSSITKSLERGKLLNNHDSLADAIKDNLITSDHVDLLVKTNSEKYKEYFVRDIDLLIENACVFSPRQFSNILSHWRNHVDDAIDDPNSEMAKFESRYLELNQLFDGNWYIHGILDHGTGVIIDKALKSGVETLWHQDAKEARVNTSKSQYRCDHLGNVFRGHVNATLKAQQAQESGVGIAAKTGFIEYNYTPAVTSDVIIDIERLKNNPTIRKFLRETLKQTSPIYKSHPNKYVEQILCDTQIDFPIRKSDGTFVSGRKNRVATSKQKRELALENNTCIVDGCSIPASWCDAHHIKHWAKGGKTTNSNLVLLCSRHHHQTHNDKTFETVLSKNISKRKQSLQQTQKRPPPILNTC